MNWKADADAWCKGNLKYMSRSEMIQLALREQPALSGSEVVDYLLSKGIKVSANLVYSAKKRNGRAIKHGAPLIVHIEFPL